MTAPGSRSRARVVRLVPLEHIGAERQPVAGRVRARFAFPLTKQPDDVGGCRRRPARRSGRTCPSGTERCRAAGCRPARRAVDQALRVALVPRRGEHDRRFAVGRESTSSLGTLSGSRAASARRRRSRKTTRSCPTARCPPTPGAVPPSATGPDSTRARRDATRGVPDHLDSRSRPGRGRTRGLGLDRIAHRAREAVQVSIRTVCCARRQVPRISPSTRSAPGHTRDVQSAAAIRLRDEKLPLRSVEQEVGVAARQQARRRGSHLGGAHGRLVLCEQPLVAERRPHRQERPFERGVRDRRRASRDPCPAGEAVGGRRPEDVEVASRELAARIGRVDFGGGDGPDGRRACALPADGDRARRRGVPERFGLTPSARPTSPSFMRAPSRWAWSCAAIRSARSRPLSSSGPPQREQREVALGNDVGAVARPPELGERADRPRSTARRRRPARAGRAARLAACCPASRPRRPAAATPRPAAFARRAHRPAAGKRESAAA